jgi:hypothetical protein
LNQLKKHIHSYVKKEYKINHYVYKQGEKANSIYFVIDGVFEITRKHKINVLDSKEFPAHLVNSKVLDPFGKKGLILEQKNLKKFKHDHFFDTKNLNIFNISVG